MGSPALRLPICLAFIALGVALTGGCDQFGLFRKTSGAKPRYDAGFAFVMAGDSGTPDAETPAADGGEDAGSATDSGAIDAGEPDTGWLDAGALDAGSIDAGLIYVLDTGNRRVETFDSNGVYQGQFGGSFDIPTGIAVDIAGNVYVKDGNNACAVWEFDNTGAFITAFGVCAPPEGPGVFDNTGAVGADRSGNVWVTSPDFYYMQEYYTGGNFLRMTCTVGVAFAGCPDATPFPIQSQGVAVDAENNLYFSNAYPLSGGFNVAKLSSTGAYLSSFGHFNYPAGIAIDSNGNVFVVDSGNNQVQKFDGTGTFVRSFGSAGAGNGQFSGPDGIAVDVNDDVYVSDTGNNRVQKFRNDGTYLLQFGTLGSGDGQFLHPTGVATGSAPAGGPGDAGPEDAGPDAVDGGDVGSCPGLDSSVDVNQNGVPDCLENLLQNGQFPTDTAPWFSIDGRATITFSSIDERGFPGSGSAIVVDTVPATTVNGGSIASECIPTIAGTQYGAYTRYFMPSGQPGGDSGAATWITVDVFADDACSMPVSTISGGSLGTTKDQWTTYSRQIMGGWTAGSLRIELGVLKGPTASDVQATFDNVLLVRE